MADTVRRLRNLCKYFKECYQEDNKTAVIDNIFEKKVEEKYFFSEESLLSGKKTVLTSKILSELKGKAYLYRKEKELLYGSLLIAGNVKGAENNKDIKVCAPLLFFPLTIKETDSADTVELSLQLKAVKVNFGLISRLFPETVAIDKNDRLEGIIVKENYFFSRETLFRLVRSLETEEVTFDSNLITLFPLLLGEVSVKKEFSTAGRSEPGKMDVLNAGFITLLKKSKGTRGIIEEMDLLGRSEHFSKPLFALFGGEESAAPEENDPENTKGVGSKFDYKTGMFHPLLSSSQMEILKSSVKNPVTLVIGPPGTGKSYTIASIALEHLFRGESVLIASRMDQAVDVIRKKIREQVGTDEQVIRGGDGEHHRLLKKRLENMAKTVYPAGELDEVKADIQRLLEENKSDDRIIEHLQAEYYKLVKKELSRGDVLSRKGLSFIRKIRAYFIDKALEKETDLFKLTGALENRIGEKAGLTSRLASAIHRYELLRAFKNYRCMALKNFVKAIKARTDGKQETIFNKTDFTQLFKIFPAWLVTSPAVYNILPLKKELFDVVIIDEATQCDITSCLPLLQRAKRAVIVGDPNQLGHVSFVSKQKQYFAGKKYNLSDDELDLYNYREKSILHAASESLSQENNCFFLDEHFRSLPQIISFSNQKIYNNSLKIMTENPRSSAKSVIQIIRCGGKRTVRGFNHEEAEAVIDTLGKIILEDTHLNQESCRTVGILSPFRKQVDYIHDLLIQTFPLTTLEKHDVLAGTAHTFQGEERDIMLLSLAIDKNSHKNSHYFISKEDVLNVSITRARVMQKIFVSLDPLDLSDKLLVRSYLEYITAFSEQEKKRAAGQDDVQKIRDTFLKEVLEELSNYKDVLTYPAYSIAGLTIDLVVLCNNKAFGIDLIGYPGEFVESFSLERYKMYYRAGLKIIPLTYSRWYFDKPACVQNILEQIDYKKR